MHFLRKIKRIVDKILETKSDELFWKFCHFFDRNWSKRYISNDSLNHPHRKLLIKEIIDFYPFKNVLEVGCASGPNLYLLAKKFSDVSFYGIDVSKNAINEGENFFLKKGLKNVFLQTLTASQLEKFASKNMDIVFTDAAIIYVGQDQIERVFREIVRIAKKAIILCEQHTDGKSFYDDKWVHNYKEIVNKNAPQANINFIKIPENIWGGDWGKYGYIITVKL